MPLRRKASGSSGYRLPMRHMTFSTGSAMWSFLINCFKVKVSLSISSSLSVSEATKVSSESSLSESDDSDCDLDGLGG